jgi:hypothetical protein
MKQKIPEFPRLIFESIRILLNLIIDEFPIEPVRIKKHCIFGRLIKKK